MKHMAVLLLSLSLRHFVCIVPSFRRHFGTRRVIINQGREKYHHFIALDLCRHGEQQCKPRYSTKTKIDRVNEGELLDGRQEPSKVQEQGPENGEMGRNSCNTERGRYLAVV